MKAVVKMLCLALLLLSVFGSVAEAQQESRVRQNAAPLTMKQVDRAQMPAADRTLLDAAQARLASAAHVFGYRMGEPGWSCNEVLTPDTPGYLMMACRKPKVAGHGESAFSALIARGGDAVYVVPVMYGGAAPWKTAANMKTSREIFNHVVPDGIAAKAMQPSGGWMTLVLTYTALVGDDSTVLAVPSSDPKWMMAPEPTIMLKSGAPERTVIFSDVSPMGGVRMWHLTFNGSGRLIATDVQVRPDLTPETVNTQTPQWQPLKNLPSPAETVTPPPVQH